MCESFTTFRDSDEIVGTAEIILDVDVGRIEAIKNEGQRVEILPNNMIETSIIYGKAKPATLLGDEEGRHASWRLGRTNEVVGEVLVWELAHGQLLYFG